jgi:hypothetical protein
MITHVIRGGRGSGKTLMLIKYSCEHQVPILVANQFRANALERQAAALGFKNMPKPFSVHDAFYRNGLVGRHEGILIDDLDCVFNTIFKHVDVHAVTYTPAWNECDLDLMNEKARVIVEKPLTDKDFINKFIKGE